MTREEMELQIENSRPIRVTRAAMTAVDTILADLKKRGRGVQFLNKEQTLQMRHQWITEIVRTVMNELRITE